VRAHQRNTDIRQQYHGMISFDIYGLPLPLHIAR
jgi:hypothetical protein